MRNSTKTAAKPTKPTKPSPYPSALPNDPDRSASDQQKGEGSYSGTRDYQESVKSYLETADVDKDAHDAAPDNAAEAVELEKAEQAGRKPAVKTQRPSKGR